MKFSDSMVFGVKICCLGFERAFFFAQIAMVSESRALLVEFSECMVLWCKKLLPGSLGIEEVFLFLWEV